jgi:hypothetical protein
MMGPLTSAHDTIHDKKREVHISPVAYHKAHELMSSQNEVHKENSRSNCLQLNVQKLHLVEFLIETQPLGMNLHSNMILPLKNQRHLDLAHHTYKKRFDFRNLD